MINKLTKPFKSYNWFNMNSQSYDIILVVNTKPQEDLDVWERCLQAEKQVRCAMNSQSAVSLQVLSKRKKHHNCLPSRQVRRQQWIWLLKMSRKRSKWNSQAKSDRCSDGNVLDCSSALPLAKSQYLLRNHRFTTPLDVTHLDTWCTGSLKPPLQRLCHILSQLVTSCHLCLLLELIQNCLQFLGHRLGLLS